MNLTVFVGLAAAGISAASYIPQMIKMWRTKSVEDVSLAMFVTIFIGYVLWFTYGVMAHSLPVIVANIFTISFTFTVVIFKIKYKSKAS